MYIDVITYDRNPEVSDMDFKAACADVHNIWMKTQVGFLGWDIGTYTENGGGVDLVYWESETDAKNAQENMKHISPEHKWFACYNVTSVTSKSLTTLHSFKKATS